MGAGKFKRPDDFKKQTEQTAVLVIVSKPAQLASQPAKRWAAALTPSATAKIMLINAAK